MQRSSQKCHIKDCAHQCMSTDECNSANKYKFPETTTLVPTKATIFAPRLL